MKPESSSYRSLNTYTKLMRASESVTGRVGRKMSDAGLTISQFGVLEHDHGLVKTFKERLEKFGVGRGWRSTLRRPGP